MLVSPALVVAVTVGAPSSGGADTSAGDTPAMRTVSATRAREPMTVDARADEPAWRDAERSAGFRERQPRLGATPVAETSFRVVYDEYALYFFVEARGQAAEEIVVRNLRRDSFSIFGDDTVTLKLDPHHDRRTSMSFAANADGVQFDSLNLEDGRVGVQEWDAVWTVETRRRSDGFDLEYRIPFAVLGIKGRDDLTLGLDVTRDHTARNATYDWRLIVPPRSPVSASSFGELRGIEGVRTPRTAEFIPYLLGRTDFASRFTVNPRDSPNLAAGGDFRIQVGTASYLEGSALTDFAQVEADEVQVARDRFPLFFPERRPFFIHGLDVFNFGAAKSGQLFFSRRIGLEEGRPIAIAGGAKSYGHVRGLSYGLLNVQSLGAAADEDDPDSEIIPPENFTVGRLRWQASDHLTVGVIGLGRHRFESVGHEAFSGGLDLELRSRDGKLQHYAFVASSWYETREELEPVADEEPEILVDETLGASAYHRLEYQGLHVRPRLSWLWSDRDFQAPLGFYLRPGSAEQTAQLDFVPRPQALGLREASFGPRVSITTSPDYEEMLTTSYGADLRLAWRAGWEASYENRYRIDEVEAPFELYLYTVEPDRYFGPSHELRVASPNRLWISGELEYQYVAAFAGVTHQPRALLRVKLGKHLGIGGSYVHRVGHLRDETEDFDFGFANGNLDIAFTRDLLWDTLLRYSMAPGTESVGLQSRLRWRYLPGSDLYLVYQTQQPLTAEAVGEIPLRPSHALTLKVAYYLRVHAGGRRAAQRSRRRESGPGGG